MESKDYQNNQSENQSGELSLFDTITGVFISPSQTFETLKGMNKKQLWFIPFVFIIILGILSTYLFNNDNELTSESKTMQKEYLQKMISNIEKKEKSNEIPSEQAAKIKEDLQKNIDNATGETGYIAIHIANIIYILFLSLVIFILMKILKGQITYINIINTIVLSMLILALGDLINIAVSILLGFNTNVGLNIFLKPPLVPLYTSVFFGAIDLFDVWFLIVLSIGVSKLANVKIQPVIITLFVVRIIIALILSFTVLIPEIMFG